VPSFGGAVVQAPGEPAEFPVVIALARDPDGYRLELLERRDPVQP
jgi:hypothetical protein